MAGAGPTTTENVKRHNERKGSADTEPQSGINERNPRMSKPKATEYAEGLRALAEMIEAQPEMAELIGYALQYGMSQPLRNREEVAALMRAGMKAGARVEKDFESSKWARVKLFFGPVKVDGFIERGEVCERMVVGTREVTEEVPDPNAPKVSITKTVEDVRWECKSLLAEERSGEMAEVAV